MPTLNAIADFAQSVSLIFTALFAMYSLDEWRREFVWKRRMDLAEEALALFYQARDVISAIRSPMGYAGEGRSREPDPNEEPADKDALDHAFSLVERYRKHSDLFARIHALRYRFMAQHGHAAAMPFDELNKCVNQLLLSASQKSRLVTSRVQRGMERDPKRIDKFNQDWKRVDAIFYEGDENDPIAPRVEAAVAAMEQSCRDVMESRGTLFSLINWRPRVRGQS